MFKVIIKFNYFAIKDKTIDHMKILNELPIKNKSNSILICKENSDPWIDYYGVTLHELHKLLDYIDFIETKDIHVVIKYKN
jgi:hypothetical protein